MTEPQSPEQKLPTPELTETAKNLIEAFIESENLTPEQVANVRAELQTKPWINNIASMHPTIPQGVRHVKDILTNKHNNKMTENINNLFAPINQKSNNQP